MPLMIEQDPIQASETGRRDPVAHAGVIVEADVEPEPACAPEACQPPARDEMWTRWA
jgi:hypothetical protein